MLVLRLYVCIIYTLSNCRVFQNELSLHGAVLYSDIYLWGLRKPEGVSEDTPCPIQESNLLLPSKPRCFVALETENGSLEIKFLLTKLMLIWRRL